MTLENEWGQKLGNYFGRLHAIQHCSNITYLNVPRFHGFLTFQEFLKNQHTFFPYIILTEYSRKLFVCNPGETNYANLIDVRLFFINFAHFYENSYDEIFFWGKYFSQTILKELETKRVLIEIIYYPLLLNRKQFDRNLVFEIYKYININ